MVSSFSDMIWLARMVSREASTVETVLVIPDSKATKQMPKIIMPMVVSTSENAFCTGLGLDAARIFTSDHVNSIRAAISRKNLGADQAGVTMSRRVSYFGILRPSR